MMVLDSDHEGCSFGFKLGIFVHLVDALHEGCARPTCHLWAKQG